MSATDSPERDDTPPRSRLTPPKKKEGSDPLQNSRASSLVVSSNFSRLNAMYSSHGDGIVSFLPVDDGTDNGSTNTSNDEAEKEAKDRGIPAGLLRLRRMSTSRPSVVAISAPATPASGGLRSGAGSPVFEIPPTTLVGTVGSPLSVTQEASGGDSSPTAEDDNTVAMGGGNPEEEQTGASADTPRLSRTSPDALTEQQRKQLAAARAGGVSSVLSFSAAEDLPFTSPPTFSKGHNAQRSQSLATVSTTSNSQMQLPRKVPYNAGRYRNYYSPMVTSDNTTLAPHRTFPDSDMAALYTFLEAAGAEIRDLALRKSIENGVYDRLGIPGTTVQSTGGKSANSSRTERQQRQQMQQKQQRLRRLASTANLMRSSTTSTNADRSGSQAPQQSVGSSDDDEDPVVAVMARTNFPLRDRNNGFAYAPVWFEEPEHPPEARESGEVPPFARGRILAAVTEDPPLLYLGMLLDPQSNRFLMQGCPFVQEARVLTVKLPRTGGEESTASMGTNMSATSADLRRSGNKSNNNNNNNNNSGSNASGGRAAAGRRTGRLLLREFFSVNKINEGFCVQTFSLLPSTDTGVAAAAAQRGKHHLLSAEQTDALLVRTLPGTFTRGFSLFNIVSRVEVPDGAEEEEVVDAEGSTARVPSRSRISSFGSFARKKSLTSMSGMDTLFNGTARRSTAGVKLTALQRQQLSRLNPAEIKASAPRKHKRDPLAEELLMRDHNPTLFEWAMAHSLEELQAPIDRIRDYLVYYRFNFSYRMLARRFMEAVRRIQRFFRLCLARKRRALVRTLRLWRQLEVECRARLQHYRPPPSAKERVELIATNVLLDEIITTREHKIALIRELWGERAAALHRWLQRQRLREDIAECVAAAQGAERNPLGDESTMRATAETVEAALSRSGTAAGGGRKGGNPPQRSGTQVYHEVFQRLPSQVSNGGSFFAGYNNRHSFGAQSHNLDGTRRPTGRARVSRLLSLDSNVGFVSGRESVVDSANTPRHKKIAPHTGLHSTLPGTAGSDGTATAAGGTDSASSDANASGDNLRRQRMRSMNHMSAACQEQEQQRKGLRHSTFERLRNVLDARQARQEEELHSQFGWYIQPEVLLYESHQRLLQSLKTSVLDMEQVQYEFARAMEETKGRQVP